MEINATGVAKGGEGVGRAPDGRVVFVPGLLRGERARIEIDAEKPRFARARLLEVLEPSVDRVVPPCPAVTRGCGGCDLQHATVEHQQELRATIVVDALQRLGRLGEVPPPRTVPLPAIGGRTTIRCRVVDGVAGFRRRHSHDVVTTRDCLVAHPLLTELLAEGDFGTAEEVTLRAGARTGERLAIVSPTRAGVRLPDDVLVVGANELAAGRRAWFHEEVAGRTWRISAQSFFQARPDGAEALVTAVGEALADIAPGGVLVDAYAGVGLFAGTVAAGRRVTAIERSRSAVADARVNLAGDPVRIVRAATERWRATNADAVVADPPRAGLGHVALDPLLAAAPSRVVLVSCDPAALARDAALLSAAGYDLATITIVDLFPHTAHVETVARFDRR